MGEAVEKYFKGAYDLHVHSSPSHVKRSIDDINLIAKGSKFLMGGIMIKNHYEPTAGRAALINEHFKFTTKAIGGIVLNSTVGGINPYACESALKMGGKFVWMPTRDSINSLKFGNMPGDFFDREGISILDKKGRLKKEFFEVLEVIKKYNGVFATGHLSAQESFIACEESIKRNIKTVLTHPDWFRTKISVDAQIELGKRGIFIEKVWANLDDGDCDKKDFLKVMKELDYENIYISTDRGIYSKKDPIDSYKDAIEFLINNGIEEKNIFKLVRDNPKILVGG